MGEYANLIVWALAFVGGVAGVFLVLMAAPAKTSILVDTAGSTARAEMRTLWGLGPKLTARALPRDAGGTPLALFNDPVRIGHALMTPGIADAVFDAVRRLYELKPHVSRITVGVNLADTAQNTVVQTAVQAAVATAPAALRERVQVQRCEAPGAELAAGFDLYGSPMQLNAIWKDLKNSRSVREFRKRLKRKPKAQKKAPKEVRAA
jgi:hypothetical protein